MIAVIGKIGVGKTTFLKNLGIDQEKIFYCDEFIAKHYLKNGIFYHEIKEKIGDFLLDKKGVSKSKILWWLDQDKRNIDVLEKIIFPKIFEALKNGKFLIVEIPVLVNKNCNFLTLFSLILCLSTNEQKRQKNLQKRNVDNLTLKQLDAKNDPKKAIKSLFGKKPIVDIYMWNFDSTQQNRKIFEILSLIK
ncbi:dephospho-CoA kinase [Mycoplasma sp. ES3157-GEN-MYC]|uniref:Dephospho-CoA kinase n=1 Tax=Mycoplasma miroungigenitalium TaxID=754515 RepID=A0A6M4JC04_9MOLU|nr:dephospho-CoA kinase [Mycoplasma miroungigenitalium]MBU4690515.1 dephospho-CoA kinase [Mycoplasma miroungigenitalium]MBU4691782.1 dephospho-CoA kinase [Mycoplasma miroungigenitalium]QJR43609.1 dephospho-CoA kinase [Mycoplasma miroungigenitalium]